MCEKCGGFVQFLGRIGKVFAAYCLNCGASLTFCNGHKLDQQGNE